MKEIIVSEGIIRNTLKELEIVINKYLDIMKHFSRVDVSLDDDFHRKYNGFYKVRQHSKVFYEKYYAFMEGSKIQESTFKETLKYLYIDGKLEASFSSKLLATVNPNLPVWDKYVLNYFELNSSISNSLSEDRRIDLANDIYEEIKYNYEDFLRKEESKNWIKLFDEYYPNKDITPIKKIDLIIWRTRVI
jgi:hypothetical protein